MAQLYGVFIILRALFPLFFVGGLYLILRRIAGEAATVISPHLVEIDTRVGSIKATLAAGQSTVEGISDSIGDIAATVSDVSGSLTVDLGEFELPLAVDPFTLADELAGILGAEITPTLEVVTKTLNDTYDILGLGQIKDVIDDVLNVMEGMAEAIGIAAIGEDAGAITVAAGNMTGALFKLWIKWRRVIRLFVVVSLVCLALIYVVWLARSLLRGLALLSGLPDPGPG